MHDYHADFAHTVHGTMEPGGSQTGDGGEYHRRQHRECADYQLGRCLYACMIVYYPVKSFSYLTDVYVVRPYISRDCLHVMHKLASVRPYYLLASP